MWLAGGAATSVWIPPGGTELTPEDEAAMESMVVDLLGAGAGRVLGAFEEFERAHPRDEPHWFLTLLGTDPQQRGKGHGLALLAANLRVVDEAGLPAYLEASNSANVPLYQRYGFVVHGSFRMPEGGPEVVTMWREPQPRMTPCHDARGRQGPGKTFRRSSRSRPSAWTLCGVWSASRRP